MDTGDSPHLLDSPDAGPAAIRGGAIRVVGFGAGVLITTLSAALLFRHLQVEDGGRYVTVLALVSIVAGLTDAGLTGIATRELVVRDPSEREPLLRNLIGMRIVLGGIGLAAAVAFAGAVGYSSSMVIGTALAGFGAILQTFQNTFAVQLMVDLRLGWVTVLELVRQVVTVVGIVVLVVVGAGLVPFLALLIPASLISLAMTVWLVRGEVPMRPSFEWEEWRTLVRDVLPYAALVLVTLIYFRLALIILSLVSTARETGYYGASFRVIEVLISVPQLAVATAFPIFVRAARDDRDRLAYGGGRMFEAMAALGLAFAIAFALGAPFVIEVIAGAEFAPAADVLQIQSVTLLLVFLIVPINFVLLSLRAHRAMLTITGCALALNALGAALLGASNGARGAALATTVADAIALVASGWVLARLGLPVRRWLAVVPRLGLAAIPAAALWFAPIGDVAKASIALTTYVVMLVVLRAIPEELRVEARRLRRSGL